MHKQNGEVRFISNHLAPLPFSANGEPEAVLSMKAVRLSSEMPSLSDVVRSEIEGIRKTLDVGPCLEEDGHTPEDNIASYVEDIDGQSVAFINYRVLYPSHQKELRDDQIRLVKSLIRRRATTIPGQ
jgi:hypothetical protein